MGEVLEKLGRVGCVGDRPQLFGRLTLGRLSLDLAVEEDRANDQIEHGLHGQGGAGSVDAGRGELADQHTTRRLEQCSSSTLAVDQRHQVGSFEEGRSQRAGHRADPGHGIPASDRDRTEYPDDPLGEAVEQGLLVPHVPVDGRRRHTQFPGQPANGQAVDTLGLEDLHAGVEHLASGQSRTGAPPGRRLTRSGRHVTMLQARASRARGSGFEAQGGGQGMSEAGRYTIISADCHGGADLLDYRGYLPSKLHAQFDDWATHYRIPFDDLMGKEASQNWDHDRRLADLEADGIVAEVIFPNTIPPFYPEPSLKVQSPGASEGDLKLRWQGLRAHNRWLADFCAAAPGRRLGIVQIMLHDVPEAVAEVEWAAEAGMTAGILLPGAPPGSGLEPLYSRAYDPLWRACEVAGLPINHHSGSAVPPLGDQDIDKVMFMLEVTWWAHRSLWHLIFAGVLERHPDLQFVFTEQGTAWIPETLGTLDFFYSRMGSATGSQELEWGGSVVSSLSMRPSEY